jgi:hypothetical protein
MQPFVGPAKWRNSMRLGFISPLTFDAEDIAPEAISPGTRPGLTMAQHPVLQLQNTSAADMAMSSMWPQRLPLGRSLICPPIQCSTPARFKAFHPLQVGKAGGKLQRERDAIGLCRRYGGNQCLTLAFRSACAPRPEGAR